MRNELARAPSAAVQVEIAEAMSDYRIVSAPIQGSSSGVNLLERRVQELIEQGLVPLGSPFMTKDYIHQAMVKSIYLVPTGV
jgi:hypothetical protein